MYTAQYQITTFWSLPSVCWSRDWFYKASAWRQQLVGDGGEDEAQLGSILHTGRSYCSASQEADPAHTSNLPHWPPIEQCSLKLMSLKFVLLIAVGLVGLEYVHQSMARILDLKNSCENYHRKILDL